MVTDARSTLVLIAVTAWQQIVHLGPYVLVGVLLAALLGQFDVSRWLGWLSRGNPVSVLGAACVGTLSPLSTCGTVPMLAQLLRGGASPGPVLAFLVASSMLNPQLFLLVLGGLGAQIAFAQLAGILILSVIVGWIATRVPASRLLQAPINAVSLNTPRSFDGKRWLGDVQRMLEWIGLTFVVGVLLSAVLQVMLPTRWVEWLLGQDRLAGVLAASVLGIPLYSCGGSAVPVLTGLSQMGMSSSVALAFLLSGPATRVSALAALGSLLTRRALAIYVVYIVIGAAVVGWLWR